MVQSNAVTRFESHPHPSRMAPTMRAASLVMLLALPHVSAAPPLPSSRRLRDIIADAYPAGTVLVGSIVSVTEMETPDFATMFNRECNYMTIDGKMSNTTKPDLATPCDFSHIDGRVALAGQHNQIVHFHSPAGPQCPAWSKDPARTPAELEAYIRDYFRHLCERYNDSPAVGYMDVVNEVAMYGAWTTHTTAYKVNPWYKIGVDAQADSIPLYIPIAFETVNQYGPDIKTLFVQHQHLDDGDDDADWELVKKSILYLLNKGLRVDAIGWQAHIFEHWETDSHIRKLRGLIDWAHQHGLEFHITEMEVHLTSGMSYESLQRQANAYKRIVETILEESDGYATTWNAWGLTDPLDWVSTQSHLFTGALEPKPAYYGIQQALERVPDGNLSPDVSVSAPQPGQVYAVGQPITVSAEASDRDGTIQRVDFYAGMSLIGSSQSPFAFVWENAPVGGYFVTARAIDNQGKTTMSSGVKVVVGDPGNGLAFDGFESGDVAAGSGFSEHAWACRGDIAVTTEGGPAYEGDHHVHIRKGRDMERGLAGSFSNATLRFAWKAKGFVEGVYAEAQIYNGEWHQVATIDHTRADEQYRVESISLGAYPGVTRIRFSVHGQKWRDNVWIDDVLITEGTVPGALPYVHLTQPAIEDTLQPGGSVDIAATAGGTTIEAVRFYAGPRLIGEDNTAPYSLTWTDIPPGDHVLSARTTDAHGVCAWSNRILIVAPPPPVGAIPRNTAAQSRNAFRHSLVGRTADALWLSVESAGMTDIRLHSLNGRLCSRAVCKPGKSTVRLARPVCAGLGVLHIRSGDSSVRRSVVVH